MRKYEPYKMDAFTELLKYAYRLGWYSGPKALFTLTCEGAFEGWSGRATETWEHRFIITSDEILSDKKVIPAIRVIGETVEDACTKALAALRTYQN